MSAGTGQADGSASAPKHAGPAVWVARMENWNHDVVALIDRLGWIRTLNDQLTAVLGPWRERHQDNPVLELMHGGRWLGHPLHPALSDLPIGLWSGALILDVTDRDPAPGRGLDPPAPGAGSTRRPCSARLASRPRSRPRPLVWSTGPSATTRIVGSACSTGCSIRRPSGCKAYRWRPG